jgi:hypothetical protein
MPVCSEVIPEEITFNDGVRVACHLYTADGIGRPVTAASRGLDEPESAPPADLVFVTPEDELP